MTDPALDLVPIWTLILGVAVFFYVLLDGFDLGCGILFGLSRDPEHRRLIMNSIAPVWDGNETWLVLGSIGLLAAFPLAFAIIMPAVYFPLLLMLLGLVFRGVAFEFQFKEPRIRRLWEWGFAIGSSVATFAQGCVLGAFVQGFKVSGRNFAGTSWDWLTPFSLLTGLSLMAGYALLGSGWLVFKLDGEAQDWARRWGRRALLATLGGIGAVSLWTPFIDSTIAARWFSWPHILWFAPVPVLTAALAFAEWRWLGKGRDFLPFLGALGLFFLSYSGMAISRFPMLVPPHYDLWQASSSPSTQAFLMVGTLFLLPIILIYSAWSYWVFRGKVRADVGHH